MPTWAVITGASSGLGAAYAALLGQRGHHLLITGRRESRLNEVSAAVRESFGVAVETVRCDLAEVSAIDELCGKIRELPSLEWMINNAGFGSSGSLADVDIAPRREMVRVHAEAPLTLTRAAIEKMVESSTGGRRTIINVGSLASILAVPGASAYVGTKAFLLAFSECVALELAGLDINVQVLLPGYFRSDFHRDMDLSEDEKRSRGLIRWMSAERVARSSVDAALRRRPPVIHVPGTANRVAYTVARLLPRRLLHALARRHFDDSRSTE